MPCYCATITRLKNKYDDLQRALEKMYSAKTNASYTESNTSVIAISYEQGVSAMNAQDSVAEDIRNVYDTPYSAIGQAESAIRTLIESVSSDINDYKRRDESYHDSLESEG